MRVESCLGVVLFVILAALSFGMVAVFNLDIGVFLFLLIIIAIFCVANTMRAKDEAGGG